jgi:hypothetical protein
MAGEGTYTLDADQYSRAAHGAEQRSCLDTGRPAHKGIPNNITICCCSIYPFSCRPWGNFWLGRGSLISVQITHMREEEGLEPCRIRSIKSGTFDYSIVL